MRKGVDFQSYFGAVVEIGNLYTTENLLVSKFKPSDATINHILQDFWDNAESLRYSFSEKLLNWMLSRRLITKDQRDDILDIHLESHE